MINNHKFEVYHHKNSDNPSSFLGTLKGEHGIMANISNQEDENLNEAGFNTGKMLNIENVLNHINQQNELSKDQNE